MGERKKGFTPPVLGGATLLTVLTVLCLTVVAMACLSAALSGRAESEAAALKVEEYYAADCKAQEILARLRRGEFPEGVAVRESIVHYEDRVEQGRICAYTVPVSDTRALRVEVEVLGYDSYTVRTWRTVSAEQ